MYKTINYRKKTAAASLAGLDLERPIRVRTMFCYIFSFQLQVGEKFQTFVTFSCITKKLRMHLELGHLPLRRTGSCSLAIRVKNALKNKKTHDFKKDRSLSLCLPRFPPFPWFVSVGLRCAQLFQWLRHKRATVGRAGRLLAGVPWPKKTLMRIATNSPLNAGRPWKDVE